MNKSKKYACIHGHFYQPPRENAWLEVLETQDSAAPYHDWNERINFECYAPNARARIINDQGHINKIVNNYARISFNFGPTLLSWMEQADPETYTAILAADRQSKEYFNGHGSAIAQVYSHLIMPLANERDKHTQVAWGLRDFEKRFGRKSEGIWLAETAVDLATLEVLADFDVKFTILAPRQAKAVRANKTADWINLHHATVDPRRPYRVALKDGRSMTVFFYDGHVSQGVAFEGLLNSGPRFAERIIGTLDGGDEVQLAHIATDGESYGHHHRKGEMALADCLRYLEEHESVTLTNYAAFLATNPPHWEAEIFDNSSWSCVHGVERWRSNCGCNSGGRQGWTQAWRAPLRETLDWLRDLLIPVYEREANKFLADPWAARNDYIEIIMNRDEKTWKSFLEKHKTRELKEDEEIQLRRLLEMQRQAILMYTSCGWFFDEISGLETNQILQYANRAIYYAKQVAGLDLHAEFVARLAEAPSNVYENGAVSYQKFVEPARVNLERVGMHFATASIFEKFPEKMTLFNYTTESEVLEKLVAGEQSLVLGRVTIRSRITRSRKHFSFAALHLGKQNIIGNLSTQMPRKDFDKMVEDTVEAFRTPDLGKVIAVMQDYIESEKFSIWHLFRDEKRKVLKEITDRSLKAIELDFRDIYNSNYQLMTSMLNSDIPLPGAYKVAIKYVLNEDLEAFFRQEELDRRQLRHLVEEFQKWDVAVVHASEISLLAANRLYQEQKALRPELKYYDQLRALVKIYEQIHALKLSVNLWRSQDLFYARQEVMTKSLEVVDNADWQRQLRALGAFLTMADLGK
jgi:alpha-amylase/alpha-mannosidase (GH57 family)